MENQPRTSAQRAVKPPQSRVIAGCLYSRSETPYAHDIRVHDLGHGHIEAVVMPRYDWREVDMLSPGALSDMNASKGCAWISGAWAPCPEVSERERLDKLARNTERSTRRARTKVRRLCKSKGLTTMMTLTYRENMLDRSRMARDFDVFMKRVRRVCPAMQYVCVFERQKRGAWHAHIAVPRVLAHYLYRGQLVRSYDLLRSLWRGVVGVDGGNVDVSRNRRVGRSSSRLASYLAKYIGKGIGETVEAGDSYRASGRALAPAIVFRSANVSLGPAVSELAALISAEMSEAGEFYHALLDCGGFYVSLSPD